MTTVVYTTETKTHKMFAEYDHETGVLSIRKKNGKLFQTLNREIVDSGALAHTLDEGFVAVFIDPQDKSTSKNASALERAGVLRYVGSDWQVYGGCYYRVARVLI